MTEVRALLFDTFGTVVDWRGGLISQLQAWGAARGVTADWAGLVDAWRGQYVPSMARVRTGERDWADLDVLQRESVQMLAPELGAGGLDGAALDELVVMWHSLPPWPDAVEGLRRLRTRFVIAPLSNGHVALLVRLSKTAGITWDAVLGADVFRHYKPDRENYLGAAALLGYEPPEVMLAAAHPADLDAAAACGLQTCHVWRPLEYGPDRIVEKPPAAERFDMAVDDIQQLADALGC
ncbi:MAG TPA: haloacid dehalogenase type II [Mycobacterium sp.]